MDGTFEEEALAVLRAALGSKAAFRPDQLPAIKALVEHGKRVLVVQRTGWGKSAVYFVATRMLRDRGAGLTIIVSPLIALMRDQIKAAERLRLNAVTINTGNKDEWDRVDDAILKDEADLLLISPERFNNPDFRDRHLVRLASNTGLLVIDEAHCISDWGHDFRPDYRRLKNVLTLMAAGRPVLCTTATANDRVVDDIEDQLGADLTVIRGNLDRESLSLHAVNIEPTFHRLAWLTHYIPRLSGSGIVYCLTVADTERVADWLNANGIVAAAYSGQTDGEIRQRIERQLKDNELKVVASTSALGMGFDKPDLSFVIHFQSPDSPVAYYQQVGRAGRAVDHADVVLLWGARDEEIWDYFLRTGLPVREQNEAVVDYLRDAGDWVRRSAIEEHVNIPSGRLLTVLKVLDVDGAVEKQPDGSWYRSTLDTDWEFDAERFDRVREARLAEHQAMRDYATIASCRMAFLRNQLDDKDGLSPCGRCDNCAGARFSANVEPSLIEKAQQFIRRRPIEIEPRVRWVGHRSGRIEHPLKPGRALCYLSDYGWGDMLREAKRSGSNLPDELLRGSVNLIRQWLPDFDGTVAYVPPSEPDRLMVPEFAVRLAEALGLAVSDCLVKVRNTRLQKSMANGAQQLNNIDGAFEIRGAVPSGEVLLIDDVVDSRWTMTVLGELLIASGCAAVYPFAVAKIKG